jgi:hypothetical protein
MFYRFSLFLTILTFSYVVSFDAMAKYVRKKRRVAKTSLYVPSSNNKYRTVHQEIKIKKSMKKYWKSKSVEELFQDAQSDYERILKRALRQNPKSDPEAEMQKIIDRYMVSERSTVVPGVKNIEKEARLYLPPKAIFYMKKSGISIKSAARKMKGRFNVRAYVDMMYSIEDEMGSLNSRQAKKYRALLKRFMKLRTSHAHYALDLSSVGRSLGTTKHLVARGTVQGGRRDRLGRGQDGTVDVPAPSNGMGGRIANPRGVGRETPVRRDAEVREPIMEYRDEGIAGLDEQDPFMEEMKNRALAEDEAFKKRMEERKKGIEDLAKKAADKAKQGMMLVGLGIGLIIAGLMMMMKPGMQKIGMMMMLAGAALLMMGMQKLGEAKEMGEEAKKQKEALEKEVDQYKKKREEEYKRLEEEQKKKIYRQRMQEMQQQKEREIRMRQQDAVQQIR